MICLITLWLRINFDANLFFEIENCQASAVPEPEAYAMMLAGLALVGFAARRKQFV